MNTVRYFNYYSTPDDYKPPEDSELRTDTHYPNLNSKDYQLNKLADKDQYKFQKFYEAFAISSEGEVILAANNIRGRMWNGTVWGFEKIDNFGKQEESCFHVSSDSPITNLAYVNDTLFILTSSNGKVQLWSPKADVRDAHGYCLFLIGGCCEHTGVVLSMDTLSDEGTKAVTGSSDCCLKVWDIGADLYSIHTIRYAHSDSITSISSSSNSEPIFVSCSRDKSALLWDYRLPRPATGLYEDHAHAFTAVYWSKNYEKSDQIILGDETGKIYCLDTKMPHKIFSSHQIYDRPIRKIKFNGKQMVVLGNTNIINVFEFKDEKENLHLIYKDSNATNFVRDVQWDKCSEKEFYAIDWDGKFHKHRIP